MSAPICTCDCGCDFARTTPQAITMGVCTFCINEEHLAPNDWVKPDNKGNNS